MPKRKRRNDDWTAWVAIKAITKGACPNCRWALKRDKLEPFVLGCPSCGEVFIEFNGELITWEGEDEAG